MDQITNRIFRNRNSLSTTFNEEIRLSLRPDYIALLDTDVVLDAEKCYIDCDLNEPSQVENIFSFRVKFYSDNDRPYPVTTRHCVNVEIENICHETKIPHVLSFTDAAQLEDGIGNEIQVSFNATKCGIYKISISPNNIPLNGSPFLKKILPGPISPVHTILNRLTHSAFSVVMSELGKSTRLTINTMDEYKNECVDRLDLQDVKRKWNFEIFEASHPFRKIPYAWEIAIIDNPRKQLELQFALNAPGIFKASLSLDGKEITNGGFDLIVTTESETDKIRSSLRKHNLNVCFECFLIKISNHDLIMNQSSNTESMMNRNESEVKPVICHLQQEQLVINERLPNGCSKRFFTFKICPATKILFHDVNETCDNSTLIIDDELQSRVVLSCEGRNVLAATYFGILHKHIGGAESFADKVRYFNTRLCKLYQLSGRNQIKIKIDRRDLLRSSFQATNDLSDKDWRKNFIVSFKDELGSDGGGVSREWNDLLCKALFDPQSKHDGTTGGSGMFIRINNDAQALVLPNSSSESGFKLKYYEFAGKIVGKCLLESAIGGEDARQVNGRFARSFLAQLIGLPVTHKYFESDDPDLYKNKVKFILDNDVNDMEMSFSEEVYNIGGTLERIVELFPHGENIAVTNENKHKYLTKLAQCRLSESIKPEIEHFIKGLSSIVPINILSILDENELELVMCGMREISVEDMKAHVNTKDATNSKILDWFWTIVSGFTQDELARLLQFVTGGSQLPSDGFKALYPKFKVSILEHQQARLPSGITCFNNLCIPNYECYEEFHRMLKIAITEGATGFGFL